MFIVILSIIAISFWRAAILVSKNNKRKFSSIAIPVQARVVSYQRNRGRQGPSKLTFDYLLPDGRTNRLTKSTLVNPVENRGLFSYINTNEIFTVYVDPAKPESVHLGAKYDMSTYQGFVLYALAAVFTINLLYVVVTAFAR